jgi:hypothetical protein
MVEAERSPSPHKKEHKEHKSKKHKKEHKYDDTARLLSPHRCSVWVGWTYIVDLDVVDGD